MPSSDVILARLLMLHPKIIDLSLTRMWRLLDRLGNPQRNLPPILHIAGTNGKGSTQAYLRSIFEAAGLKTHCYISPHLVKFHERIRLAGTYIEESYLTALLEECETLNCGEPITFFEITTAAAFLAFSRAPADYLILEVGLGGRFDATNVVVPQVSIITNIDYDHQSYLGPTLKDIAHEKAGVLKTGVPAAIAPQPMEALLEIEIVSERLKSPLSIANRDWQAYEQHGRLVFQNSQTLLDLPLPALAGRHQIDNAGTALAALHVLDEPRITESHIAQGLKNTRWPARMQRLTPPGRLNSLLPDNTELWLDGGHNPAAGRALAAAFSSLNERHSRPLILIWGMLNSKDATGFIEPFCDIAQRVIALKIQREENSFNPQELCKIARNFSIPAETAASLEQALTQAAMGLEPVRILICGSLYLAGHSLAQHHCDGMPTR